MKSKFHNTYKKYDYNITLKILHVARVISSYIINTPQHATSIYVLSSLSLSLSLSLYIYIYMLIDHVEVKSLSIRTFRDIASYNGNLSK